MLGTSFSDPIPFDYLKLDWRFRQTTFIYGMPYDTAWQQIYSLDKPVKVCLKGYKLCNSQQTFFLDSHCYRFVTWKWWHFR